VLFHQDNASCHKSIKTTAKLQKLGYELLPHPPYSLDLAPSDFFCLQTSKECLLERNLALMKRFTFTPNLSRISRLYRNRTVKMVEKLYHRYNNRCIVFEFHQKMYSTIMLEYELFCSPYSRLFFRYKEFEHLVGFKMFLKYQKMYRAPKNLLGSKVFVMFQRIY
jgi:hypothetical protein